MKFAVNYSPQASALVQAGQIAFDWFKCPDWPTLVEQAQATLPAYIHFPISLGSGGVPGLDLDSVAGWLARTETPHVNAHIMPTADVAGTGRADVIATLVADIQRLTERFGRDAVVIENVPYSQYDIDHGVVELGVQADLIHEVVETTGCRFLFDISHAVLVCERFGWDYADYVARLPLQSLGELHVTGIGSGPDGELTDHLALLPADWARLEAIVVDIVAGRYPVPRIMAFEYGGIGELFDWRSEERVLAEQVPRLLDLARRIAPAPVLDEETSSGR